MGKLKFKKVGDGYECIERFVYYSKRYKKCIVVPKGFYSDGATGARDIDSSAWWVHDVICRYGCFDDGTKCSNWQASTILYDILKEEGFYFRAPWWRVATFLFGGGAAREEKVYKNDR